MHCIVNGCTNSAVNGVYCDVHQPPADRGRKDDGDVNKITKDIKPKNKAHTL